ncbi:MAG: peptidoglycan-binding protein [Alphaproteobacteria bacterium]|nr:peptidoglycan-binding protein [Alphaproteobacteria bacterium]
MLGSGRLRGGLIETPRIPYPWVREECTLEAELARGSRGLPVRVVQEHLCLQGVGVPIDGEFGPATEEAVRAFQRNRRLKPTGRVDANTFGELTLAIRAAISPLPTQTRGGLGAAVRACAAQHLRNFPREVGPEPHMGPWVRLYMHGKEGYRWSTGFVNFALSQAAFACGIEIPLHQGITPEAFAHDARGRSLLVTESEAANADLRGELFGPGALFVQKDGAGGYGHIGIVMAMERDSFVTIEAAPPDIGGWEGGALTQRRRAYRGKEFILLSSE